MEGSRFNAARFGDIRFNAKFNAKGAVTERCPYFIQIDFSPLTLQFVRLRDVFFLKSADCRF
jgi:hypothetical protein